MINLRFFSELQLAKKISMWKFHVLHIIVQLSFKVWVNLVNQLNAANFTFVLNILQRGELFTYIRRRKRIL